MTASMSDDDAAAIAPKVIEFQSADSPTTLYACGWCKRTVPSNTRQAAEECCTCTRCGSRLTEDRSFYVTCRDCDTSSRTEREAVRRATGMAKPVVRKQHDGPVFVDDWDEYFEDQWTALDRCHDDGIDPATVLVHPCIVRKAPVPDLAEAVTDTWAEQYDDPDAYDIDLSAEAAAALAEAVALIERDAPTVWVPYTGERIDLSTPVDSGRAETPEDPDENGRSEP